MQAELRRRGWAGHNKPLPAQADPALSSWAPCSWGRSQGSWEGTTANLASAQDPQKDTNVRTFALTAQKHRAPRLNNDVQFKAELQTLV